MKQVNIFLIPFPTFDTSATMSDKKSSIPYQSLNSGSNRTKKQENNYGSFVAKVKSYMSNDKTCFSKDTSEKIPLLEKSDKKK